jgi:peptidoglycan/xylan/chitin deacetylase (PgdA/CDA1 family)
MEDLSTLRTALEQTRRAIAGPTGLSPASIRDIRPPYGVFTKKVRTSLVEWGYRLVMWNCIPPHWMQPVGWSIRQVLESALPGAVIVLHDGHGHGRRVTEIVDAIVPQIRASGFEFITVDEMQARRQSAEVPAGAS